MATMDDYVSSYFTLYVKQSYYIVTFESLLEFACIRFWTYGSYWTCKCFYLSRNLFPSFGYGKLKCVFAVIWPYMLYDLGSIDIFVLSNWSTCTLVSLHNRRTAEIRGWQNTCVCKTRQSYYLCVLSWSSLNKVFSGLSVFKSRWL